MNKITYFFLQKWVWYTAQYDKDDTHADAPQKSILEYDRF